MLVASLCRFVELGFKIQDTLENIGLFEVGEQIYASRDSLAELIITNLVAGENARALQAMQAVNSHAPFFGEGNQRKFTDLTRRIDRSIPIIEGIIGEMFNLDSNLTEDVKLFSEAKEALDQFSHRIIDLGYARGYVKVAPITDDLISYLKVIDKAIFHARAIDRICSILDKSLSVPEGYTSFRIEIEVEAALPVSELLSFTTFIESSYSLLGKTVGASTSSYPLLIQRLETGSASFDFAGFGAIADRLVDFLKYLIEQLSGSTKRANADLADSIENYLRASDAVKEGRITEAEARPFKARAAELATPLFRRKFKLNGEVHEPSFLPPLALPPGNQAINTLEKKKRPLKTQQQLLSSSKEVEVQRPSQGTQTRKKKPK